MDSFSKCFISEDLSFDPQWGRLASTWVQKQEEQAEAHEDLVKNVYFYSC
jgi:hypothetical protein